MATLLTSVFGNHISVAAQPRTMAVQLSAYPGAHGITGMRMGTRGRAVTVAGRLYATGLTYPLARAAMDSLVAAIEAYYTVDPADYEHLGSLYSSLYLETFTLVPGGDGKLYHLSGGYLYADFVAVMRGMV